MSLELEIKALTVAVLELTNTIISGAKTVPPAAAAKMIVARDAEGMAAAAKQPAPPAQPTQKPLDYQADIRPKVITLGGIPGGREAVTKLLGQFNVDHASKIPVENWPMLLVGLDKIKAELGSA